MCGKLDVSRKSIVLEREVYIFVDNCCVSHIESARC